MNDLGKDRYTHADDQSLETEGKMGGIGLTVAVHRHSRPFFHRLLVILAIFVILGGGTGFIAGGVLCWLSLQWSADPDSAYWIAEPYGWEKADEVMGPRFVKMEQEGSLNAAVLEEIIANPPEPPPIEDIPELQQYINKSDDYGDDDWD